MNLRGGNHDGRLSGFMQDSHGLHAAAAGLQNVGSSLKWGLNVLVSFASVWILSRLLSAACLGATAPTGCLPPGRLDVYILVDVSQSMKPVSVLNVSLTPKKKSVFEDTINFIESKTTGMNSGLVTIGAFDVGLAKLDPTGNVPQLFETLLSENDDKGRQRLNQFFWPEKAGPLSNAPKWKGFRTAIDKHTPKASTDIGAAIHETLTRIEGNIKSGLVAQNACLQLWVLTDSAEGTSQYPIAELLQRFKRLRENVSFDYHEIVFCDPPGPDSPAGQRHRAITGAGFFVDYSPDLASRIRVAVGQIPPAGLVATGVVGCGLSDFVAQTETPITFEACKVDGSRPRGTFNLTLNRHSASQIPVKLELQNPFLGADDFGKAKPLGLKVGGLAGLKDRKEWPLVETVDVEYTFQADTSTLGGTPDYLSSRKFPVKIVLNDEPPVELALKCQDLTTPGVVEKKMQGGDTLATFSLQYVNGTTPAPLQVDLKTSNPNELMITNLGDTGNTITLSPTNRTVTFEVVTRACTNSSLEGRLRVLSQESGPCKVSVEGNEYLLRATIRHDPAIQWFTKEGAPGQLPDRVVLSAIPENGIWTIRERPKAPGVSFDLSLPEGIDLSVPFTVSLRGPITNAVHIKLGEKSTTSVEHDFRSPGAYHLSLTALSTKEAESKKYSGTICFRSKGATDDILPAIPIDIYLSALRQPKEQP